MPTMGKASDAEGGLTRSFGEGFRGAGFLLFASGGMPAFVSRTGFAVFSLPFFAAGLRGTFLPVFFIDDRPCHHVEKFNVALISVMVRRF